MKRQLVERELTSEGPAIRPARRGGRSVTINLAESPLGWLFARGRLSARQYDAGERLRADWERAQLSPSVTMRWDAVRVKSTGDSGLGGAERQMGRADRARGGEARQHPLSGKTMLGTRRAIAIQNPFFARSISRTAMQASGSPGIVSKPKPS